MDTAQRRGMMLSPSILFGRGRIGNRTLRRLYAPVRQVQRARTEEVLAAFSRGGGASPAAERVLIDAMFDNPNYWLRYAVARRALGLPRAAEIGLTGRYRAVENARTLARFGVADTRPLARWLAPPDRRVVDRLLAGTRRPDDVLQWELPFGYPASDAYDAILKRQRRNAVDVRDPALRQHVEDILAMLHAADRLLDEIHPDLVLLSHTASGNVAYGPLTWQIARRAIPILVPWGQLDTLRFYRVRRWEDGYRWEGSASASDMDGAPLETRAALTSLGERYLSARLGGRTDDAASLDAFARPGQRPDRGTIARRFGWDPQRPVVAVYASVWFDNPHVFGMRNFRDFADWLELTVATAAEVPEVSWLIKPHPAERFYGGPTVEAMFAGSLPANVGICPQAWNGQALLEAIDAVITLHGTIGLEATHLGKPVLAADRGWYHEAGFVQHAATRDAYAAMLRRPWWQGHDAAAAAARARLFAGWYYGRPAWQGGLRYDEDHLQEALYTPIRARFEAHAEILAREADAVRAWWDSGEPNLHIFKMRQARAFVLPHGTAG